MRPRPLRPVPLPRDGPRRLYPALAAARRTCAARLWTLRPEHLPASRLLPGRTRKSSSPTVMSAPKLALPPADILKSRHIQKIAPPGRSGCHLKISPTYNPIMPHRWRAFYLAIYFPFLLQCLALFYSYETRRGGKEG